VRAHRVFGMRRTGESEKRGSHREQVCGTNLLQEPSPHGQDALASALEREDLVPRLFVECGYAAAYIAGDLKHARLDAAGPMKVAPMLLLARDDPAAVSALARVLRLSSSETTEWLARTARLLKDFAPEDAARLLDRMREVVWAWGPLPWSTRRPH
jgi:hypothetical protein